MKQHSAAVAAMIAALATACADSPTRLEDDATALGVPGIHTVGRDQPTAIAFALPDVPAAPQRAYLTFRARIDWPTPYNGGSANPLLVWLNPASTPVGVASRIDVKHQALGVERLVNKPHEYVTRNGERVPWTAGKGWRLLYSSDYSGGLDDSADLVDVVNGNPYVFRLDVTDRVRAGDNQLFLQVDGFYLVGRPVIVDQIAVEYLDPLSPAQPAPTPGGPAGPLPTHAPDAGAVAYQLDVLGGGAMRLTVGGTTYDIESELGIPLMDRALSGGAIYNRLTPALWAYNEPGFAPAVTRESPTRTVVRATGHAYTFRRQIDLLSDHVAITDEIGNTTAAPIGIDLQHNTPLAGTGNGATVVMAGSRLPWTSRFHASTDQYPENPTIYLNAGAYLGSGTGGLAFLARDDVFRAHARLFVDSPFEGNRPHFDASRRRVGFGDARLRIAPGATHVSRWAIFPTEVDDYWRFVNRARRVIGVNFPIPGSLSFLAARSPLWTAAEKAEFVADRGLGIVSAGGGYHWDRPWHASDPHIAHGLDFPRLKGDPSSPHWIAGNASLLDDFRTTAGVESLVYFHAFASYERSHTAGAAYEGERMRDTTALGTQAIAYHNDPVYPMYTPLLGQPYGQALQTNLDIIVGEMRSGVFWDEMDHSWYRVVDGDDGHTAELRIRSGAGLAQTGWEIVRPRASLTLRSLAWRADRARWLLDGGRTLVGNGAPETETMASLHFPRFVETNGGATLLRKTHLYTPIALGDFLWDGDDAWVAEQIWQRLEEGGLYYHYRGDADLRYRKITSYMFPFTPVDLRPGVLIGAERILLSQSAVVGWGDGTLPSEVHVFDASGRELDAAPFVALDPGAGLVTVRMPHRYTAALIRGGAASVWSCLSDPPDAGNGTYESPPPHDDFVAVAPFDTSHVAAGACSAWIAEGQVRRRPSGLPVRILAGTDWSRTTYDAATSTWNDVCHAGLGHLDLYQWVPAGGGWQRIGGGDFSTHTDCTVTYGVWPEHPFERAGGGLTEGGIAAKGPSGSTTSVRAVLRLTGADGLPLPAGGIAVAP